MPVPAPVYDMVTAVLTDLADQVGSLLPWLTGPGIRNSLPDNFFVLPIGNLVGCFVQASDTAFEVNDPIDNAVNNSAAATKKMSRHRSGRWRFSICWRLLITNKLTTAVNLVTETDLGLE